MNTIFVFAVSSALAHIDSHDMTIIPNLVSFDHNHRRTMWHQQKRNTTSVKMFVNKPHSTLTSVALWSNEIDFFRHSLIGTHKSFAIRQKHIDLKKAATKKNSPLCCWTYDIICVGNIVHSHTCICPHESVAFSIHKPLFIQNVINTSLTQNQCRIYQ